MKTNSRLMLIITMPFFWLLFNCSSDNSQSSELENKENLEINNTQSKIIAGGNNPTCILSGPVCGYKGFNVTYTFYPSPSFAQVIWTYSGTGITPLGGSVGNGTSQTFQLASNFSGATINASSNGEFGCKDTIDLEPCVVNPTCYIFGPDCGFADETLSYSFSGNSQAITWTSSPSISLSSPQGSNPAQFVLNSSFTNGTITASTASCQVTFNVSDCCEARYVRSNNYDILQYVK